MTCDSQLFHRRADVIGNALSPTVDREDGMDTLVGAVKCFNFNHIVQCLLANILFNSIHLKMYHVILVGVH